MISNWINALSHDRAFLGKNALMMVVVIALFARITLLSVGKTYIHTDFWMTNRLFDRKAALIAADFFCFYPPAIMHATGRIWDTTLFTTMSLFFLNFLIMVERKWTIIKALIAGVLFGIIALFKVIILALYPFVIIQIFSQKSILLIVRLQ